MYARESKRSQKNAWKFSVYPDTGWRLNVVTVIVATVCLVIDLITPHGYGNIILYLVVLFFTIFNARRRLIMVWAGIISILLLIGFMFSPPADEGILKDMINRLIVLTFVWVVSFVGEAYKRQQEVLSRMASIMESSSDAIIATDTKGFVQHWNHSAFTLYGYHQKEMQGRVYKDVFVDPREEKMIFESVKAGRTIRGWETRHKNKQKKHFDVALSAWPIKDFSGKITGVSMIVRDISWRKDLERQRHNYLQRLEAEVGKRTEELIEKNARLRHLSAYMHDVREQERATIAREIHDELGQWLTALKMDLALSQRYITKDIDRASRKLKDMTHVVDSTIGSVQRLVSELRPTVLDNLGLVPALEWYLQEFEKRYHIPARMEIESDETDFSDQTAIAIYRIFQECLSNIARHAGATEVVMQISQDGDTWKLTVADNGIGLPPEKLQEDRSFGLMGMQERAEACGGSVDFVTAPGQGTKITLYIPLVRTYGQNINH